MRPAALLVVAAMLVLAGCATGAPRTPVEASGGAATVPAAATADVGYEHVGTATRRLNATVAVTLSGDVEVTERQPVNASVPVARYRRSTSAGPSVVALAASPLVQVVENPPRSGDPLSTLSTAVLVAFVQSTYGEPTDLAEAGTRTVEVLGVQTDLTTYRGTAALDGGHVRVAVHVARVEHGGDVVTVVAVHPRTVDERDRLVALLDATRHRTVRPGDLSVAPSLARPLGSGSR